jgi:aspartate-semialdehyde dehydrogenase
MMRVGLVGWRGMVGSVLLQRMREEGDFARMEPVFFSTSHPHTRVENILPQPVVLQDAYSVDALKACDVVLSCQGGDYTLRMHPLLRASGWAGHWIDAASALRMASNAVIILDPVNMPVIEQGLNNGCKDWIGGNCTVSCMLMAVGALYKAGWVEWMSTQTYQAASGGGAAHMRELLTQYGLLHHACADLLNNPAASILAIDQQVVQRQRTMTAQETQHFTVPLGGSLIPWIDKDMGNGQSREEWKGMAETNKILGRGEGFAQPAVPVDGFCVRVGAMRCHSQALTLKLTREVPVAEIEAMIAQDNPWVKVVPNTREDTLQHLTPVAVSGTLSIPVGRIRTLAMGPTYIGAFTIGDQLLWGAAEPLRRMLGVLLA